MFKINEQGHAEINSTHYVITFNPTDYPGDYVVREWFIPWEGSLEPRAIVGTADTLEEARALIPDGHFKMSRNTMDDPVIVETWI